MKNVMLTATEARAKTQNDLLIFNETRDIEIAILTAIDNRLYSADITGTRMTATTGDNLVPARLYFQTWQGAIEDRAKAIQMNQIIKYFTDLGYSIERRTNPNTGDTFKWLVSW
jgi:hypothetical protein